MAGIPVGGLNLRVDAGPTKDHVVVNVTHRQSAGGVRLGWRVCRHLDIGAIEGPGGRELLALWIGDCVREAIEKTLDGRAN